jgi:hypothetical protein
MRRRSDPVVLVERWRLSGLDTTNYITVFPLWFVVLRERQTANAFSNALLACELSCGHSCFSFASLFFEKCDVIIFWR